MKYFSPKELSALLHQSPENIRLWSIEFARHLSESAAPKEKRKHRNYTDDDMAVMGLVADYTNRNISFAEIHKALDNNERMMPAVAIMAQPDQSLALQKQITDLQTQLDHERALRHEAEGQVKLLERQVEKLQERLFKREW